MLLGNELEAVGLTGTDNKRMELIRRTQKELAGKTADQDERERLDEQVCFRRPDGS